ncbi:MAG: phenylalanine--tRNA ligase beta subunit-related protein [Candidatus Hodarchaeales archaeon]|jgi:DNA/RNA-binding domain of Phe-tRNA-synthetase-like protein
MQINLTVSLKEKYPDSRFGNLILRDVQNIKNNDLLEDKKQSLEREIREKYVEVDKDNMIRYYNSYFKLWRKTYPIEYQINTVKNGGNFPQVSVLVDCMFIAELKSRILTSGHDLDEINGDLIFDISQGGEQYLKLNGRKQVLKKNDIILKDNEGILASILYGPARRTSISLKTKNSLFFAWCPYKMDEGIIKSHLNEIFLNLNSVFESITSEIQLISP